MSQRPVGDMDPEAFRREGHRIVDWLADYLAAPEQYPVLSRSRPGDLARALPAAAPEDGEPFEAIFADFEQHVVPGLTHWNHPGFFAYFAISASGPGILAEMLSAGLNVQAMLWRTSPAATELEQVTLRWLAQLIELPSAFEGVIYDTASISTLHALAAARELVVPDVRARGCSRAGPPGRPRLLLRTRALVHRQGRAAARIGAAGHPSNSRGPLSLDARRPPRGRSPPIVAPGSVRSP